jgi:hypothetical protein
MRCRQFAFVFALWLALCSSAGLQAATLHAIIAAHTTDEDIGSGVKCNVDCMTSLFNQIAQGADLELKLTVFRDHQFSSRLIFDHIKGLQVEADDVIIYYHSSHGFRTPQMQEQWPGLFFGWHQNALRLQDVMEVIEQKPQRLALIIAEVCNNTIEFGPQFYHMDLGSWFDFDGRSKQNYYRLFRDFCGTIVATSSEPGQYSWIDLRSGGLFTTSFVQSMRSALKCRNPDWSLVLQKTCEGASQKARDYGKTQSPISALQERREEQ